MSEIYPETPAAPDNLPRDTSTWLGAAMQAASHAYRVEHGYALVLLDRMGNVERKSWAAVVRTIDALVGDRDMRIEVPEAVNVTRDPRCPTCDADPTEPKPATVIVVTEFVFGGGLHERRYTADGIDLEDGALAITRGSATDGDIVAVYAKNHWHHAREDSATVPGDADELRELLAEVLNDASPSPAHAGWIERAQALGVKGWDGDPIGASLSDTIEEQDQ